MYDKLNDDGELDPEWKGKESTDQQASEPPRLNRILHKSSGDGDGGTNRYEIVCNFDLDGKTTHTQK